jgi:hypothetical protein
MSNPLFKTAWKDYNAKTADPRHLTIDSTKNTLKLFDIYKGTVETESPNYWNDVYIEHNLGYQPYLELYYKILGETFWTKAPNLKYDTDPNIITEEVSIQRPDTDTVKALFLSGDVFAGIGTEEIFEYVCKIYINAWEDSWYE